MTATTPSFLNAVPLAALKAAESALVPLAALVRGPRQETLARVVEPLGLSVEPRWKALNGDKSELFSAKTISELTASILQSVRLAIAEQEKTASLPERVFQALSARAGGLSLADLAWTLEEREEAILEALTVLGASGRVLLLEGKRYEAGAGVEKTVEPVSPVSATQEPSEAKKADPESPEAGLEAYQPATSLRIAPVELREALSAAALPVDPKDERAFLRGVRFDYKRGYGLNLIGTDGKTTAIRWVPGQDRKDDCPQDAAATLPWALVKTTLAALKDAKKTDLAISVSIGPDFLAIVGANGEVIAAAPADGTFPDWRTAFQRADSPRAVLSIPDFPTLVAAAKQIAADDSKRAKELEDSGAQRFAYGTQTWGADSVELVFGPEGLHVHPYATNIAPLRVGAPTTFPAPEIRVYFSVSRLAKLAKLLKGAAVLSVWNERPADAPKVACWQFRPVAPHCDNLSLYLMPITRKFDREIPPDGPEKPQEVVSFTEPASDLQSAPKAEPEPKETAVPTLPQGVEEVGPPWGPMTSPRLIQAWEKARQMDLALCSQMESGSLVWTLRKRENLAEVVARIESKAGPLVEGLSAALEKLEAPANPLSWIADELSIQDALHAALKPLTAEELADWFDGRSEEGAKTDRAALAEMLAKMAEEGSIRHEKSGGYRELTQSEAMSRWTKGGAAKFTEGMRERDAEFKAEALKRLQETPQGMTAEEMATAMGNGIHPAVAKQWLQAHGEEGNAFFDWPYFYAGPDPSGGPGKDEAGPEAAQDEKLNPEPTEAASSATLSTAEEAEAHHKANVLTRLRWEEVATAHELSVATNIGLSEVERFLRELCAERLAEALDNGASFRALPEAPPDPTPAAEKPKKTRQKREPATAAAPQEKPAPPDPSALAWWSIAPAFEKRLQIMAVSAGTALKLTSEIVSLAHERVIASGPSGEFVRGLALEALDADGFETFAAWLVWLCRRDEEKTKEARQLLEAKEDREAPSAGEKLFKAMRAAESRQFSASATPVLYANANSIVGNVEVSPVPRTDWENTSKTSSKPEDRASESRPAATSEKAESVAIEPLALVSQTPSSEGDSAKIALDEAQAAWARQVADKCQKALGTTGSVYKIYGDHYAVEMALCGRDAVELVSLYKSKDRPARMTCRALDIHADSAERAREFSRVVAVAADALGWLDAGVIPPPPPLPKGKPLPYSYDDLGADDSADDPQFGKSPLARSEETPAKATANSDSDYFERRVGYWGSYAFRRFQEQVREALCWHGPLTLDELIAAGKMPYHALPAGMDSPDKIEARTALARLDGKDAVERLVREGFLECRLGLVYHFATTSTNKEPLISLPDNATREDLLAYQARLFESFAATVLQRAQRALPAGYNAIMGATGERFALRVEFQGKPVAWLFKTPTTAAQVQADRSPEGSWQDAKDLASIFRALSLEAARADCHFQPANAPDAFPGGMMSVMSKVFSPNPAPEAPAKVEEPTTPKSEASLSAKEVSIALAEQLISGSHLPETPPADASAPIIRPRPRRPVRPQTQS